MDRKSWPWKKKSSEKATPVTDQDQDQENGKKTSYIQISFDQYSHFNSLKDDVHKYEELVANLQDQIKELDSKLSTANADITAKEALVKQHSKVAEEAVSGWEKAEAEASALKTHLETVTLAKLTVEDRAAHLDGALKECMKQVRSLKEENEQKLHDVIVTNTNQMDKLRDEIESKIGEFERELLRSGAENDALSKSLQERSNMVMRISEEKSRAESEIEHLKNNIESCEREINTLKYETHVITKELEIRNEEKNMSMRSAEAANKQHLEGVKKIAKLEAECQRLRTLVRKKLPGPAALAQMKMEVESLGRGDYGDHHRQRRSPARPSSPLMSPMSQISDFSLDNMQKFHKENDLLTERLLAMEEETNMLKEALAKRNSELQVSRNLCARTSNRLQTLETQIMSKSPSKSGFEMHVSNPPSMASMSEDGNEDARSIAGSLMSELSQTNKDRNSEKMKKNNESANQLELMDDFLEMEKLACLPSGDSDAEILPLKKRISTLLQSLPKDAAFEKILAEVRCAIEDAGGPNVNGHAEEKEIALQNETTEEKVTQELAHALSQIYHFVSYLAKEATLCQEDTFSPKVQELSVTLDRVLSKEKTLVDFLFDLSRVLVEATELKINVVGLKASEVEEIHSPDCIDKVALSGEHYQSGCSQSSDSEIPDDSIGYEHKLSPVPCKFTSEEFEGLKLEKEKAETNVASCEADLEATKSKLQETEQILAEVKSDLEFARKSNGMAETQLKCMVESYRSLETRSAELEVELSSLKVKIENLEDELHEEKENHREALTKCQELEEQLQRNNQTCQTSSVTEADDPKSKQDNELAAAAEKLQECQETILLLGKQLKSMSPQTEQVASSPSLEQALNTVEENEYTTSTNPQDKTSSSPSHKDTPSMTTMRSPVGSKHRHTKSNSSSSSSGFTPEKHSKGLSRFFSKAK
ncbi:Filament-like plant protein 4 [Raphanus sativus]|uniref:Filament-like plant protein 4 n=1 Tax=Raphanus sativus TaxID=3726 RepID=A0A6J0KRH6_RAPSA|nr:filament-like plant protein 4 [Raphanus sativus]XP_018450526.1 filament-like plant protein 4 [Raphanus sativus]KAJ4879528.1 Filament-like plant protein 4 [Raphanus sativus]